MALTGWFKISSGLKHGYVMSEILFLLVVDWVTRKTTEGRRSGIRWDFISVLDDLNSAADDIALLASKYEHI